MPVEENAAPAPVLSVLVVPVKLTVPPVLADMSMPPPASLVSLMLPAQGDGAAGAAGDLDAERPLPLPIVPG